MIITFCGHSDFIKNEVTEKKFLSFLGETVGEECAEFYLGDYGNFDSFAYNCCRIYKQTHPNVLLVFVTPYLEEEYITNRPKYRESHYDSIIYPSIENKPKRFAIFYRNKYMVEQADFIIAYVNKNYGGAYTTYRYAKKMGKVIFNLADFK